MQLLGLMWKCQQWEEDWLPHPILNKNKSQGSQEKKKWIYRWSFLWALIFEWQVLGHLKGRDMWWSQCQGQPPPIRSESLRSAQFLRPNLWVGGLLPLVSLPHLLLLSHLVLLSMWGALLLLLLLFKLSRSCFLLHLSIQITFNILNANNYFQGEFIVCVFFNQNIINIDISIRIWV